MTEQFDRLVDILDIERLDRDLYRSTYHFYEPYPLYGGQVAAQALLAAARSTPEDRIAHSMHCYYLRAGDPQKQIIFHVATDFDGGSFSSRRVIAVQEGEVIFNCTVSFQRATEGPEHQLVVARQIGDLDHLAVRRNDRLHSAELRSKPPAEPGGRWPDDFYTRVTADLGNDGLLHAAALIYLSDSGSGLGRFRTRRLGFTSTIDHTVWLHHVPNVNDWMLFNYSPVRTGGGRGLYNGTVFGPDGELIATFAQEMLFRYARDSKPRDQASEDE